MAQDLARRRLEIEDQERAKKAEAEVAVQTVSVLQDAAGLKLAAQKASNGGKKRIVGLYLPDGDKIIGDDKKPELNKKKKDKEKEEKTANKKGLSGDLKKDVATEKIRKGNNLTEVGQAYHLSREFRQRRAEKEKKNEEQIDDEDAAKKAKVVLGKSSETELKAFGELFNFFDTDGDRNWGSIEFAQAMTDIGFPTGVEDAANLLYFAGVRDVDRITFNDFLAMMPKLKAYRRIIEKDAMAAFSLKDKGSGFVSLRDLKDVIEAIAGPEGADKNFVAAVLKKADRERTGRIPFDFFVHALFGSPPLLPYERDMKKASFMQQLMAGMGRCCGAAPKEAPHWEDEDEEEQDGRA